MEHPDRTDPVLSPDSPATIPRATPQTASTRPSRRFPDGLRSLGFGFVACLILLFFFSPRFVLWRLVEIPEVWCNPEMNRAFDTLAQLDTPFKPVDNETNWVIRWRLFFPLLWRLTGLPKPGYLALPLLGCLVTLTAVAHLIRQVTRRAWVTLAAVVVMGASSWFFVSAGWLAYFDSWLVLCLLVVAFVPSRLALCVAMGIGPWIEERFIIALPLTMLVRFIHLRRLEEETAKRMVQEAALAVTAMAGYVGLRLGLHLALHDYSARYLSRHLDATWLCSIPRMQFIKGIVAGQRGGLLFLGLFFWFAGRGRARWWQVVLWSTGMVTLVLSLVIAGDLSRSTMMFFPAALGGLILTARNSVHLLNRSLPVILALTLLLPAAHVVTVFTIPINRFPFELAAWRHPPDSVNPEFYAREAQLLASRGETDLALEALGKALALDPAFRPARSLRAQLRIDSGDGAGAMTDPEALRKHDPGNPEGSPLRGAQEHAR